MPALFLFLNFSLWQDLVNYCCGGALTGRCMFTLNPSPDCQNAVVLASSIISYGLNEYNLYAPCDGGVPQNTSEGIQFYHRLLFPWRSLWKKFKFSLTPGLPRLLNSQVRRRARGVSRERVDRANLFRSLPRTGLHSLHKWVSLSIFLAFYSPLIIDCTDDSTKIAYMNKPSVREALNIPEFVQQWFTCDEDVYQNYKRVYTDLSEQYKSLVEKGVASKYYFFT